MICTYCSRLFSRKSEVRRHYATCKAVDYILVNNPVMLTDEVVLAVRKYRTEFQMKKEARKIAKARSTQSRDEAIKREIEAEYPGGVIAPPPAVPEVKLCTFCQRPCRNAYSLRRHMEKSHKVPGNCKEEGSPENPPPPPPPPLAPLIIPVSQIPLPTAG
jgi:hypothetical protein